MTPSIPTFRTLKNSLDLPWTVEYTPVTERHGGELPAYQVFNASGNTVCEIDREPDEQQQAIQAALIAAAPELFKALEYFFNIMHDYESSRQKGYVKAALNMARGALDRAGSMNVAS